MNHLLATVKALHPALDTEPVSDDLFGLDPALDEKQLTLLLQALQQQYATAGTRYWSTRIWLLLTWQPVYLAVAATEANRLIDLTALRQYRQGATVVGFQEPTHRPALNRSLAIRHNARELRAVVDQTWRLLNASLKLNRRNSLGLISDTLLNALVSAYELRHPRQLTDLLRESGEWARAAGLLNRHRQPLSSLTVRNHYPEVSRCSCCRHYLTDAASTHFCSDCPLLQTNKTTRQKASQDDKPISAPAGH